MKKNYFCKKIESEMLTTKNSPKNRKKIAKLSTPGKKLDQKTLRESYELIKAQFCSYTRIEMNILLTLLYLTQKFDEERNVMASYEEIGNIQMIHESDSVGDQYVITINSLKILQNEGKNSKNVDVIRDSLLSLGRKPIIMLDENQKRETILFPFIKIITEKNTTQVHVIVGKEAWRAFTEIKNHYAQLDMKVILNLNSKHSLRMYQVLQSMSPVVNEMKLTVDQLKFFLDIENNVMISENTHLTNKVLKPAQKDLDKNSPVSFSYKYADMRCINGKRMATSIIIKKIFADTESAAERAEIVKTVKSKGLGAALSWKEILQLNMFEIEEMETNAPLFIKAKATGMDLVEFIKGLWPAAQKKNNPKGWIIAMLKSYIGE